MAEEATREELILKTLDECINDSPKWGICPTVFRTLKAEIERIIEERNKYKDDYETYHTAFNGAFDQINRTLAENKSLEFDKKNLIAIASTMAELMRVPQNVNVMLDDGAIEPTRAHEHDAGLDLYAKEDFTVPARSSAIHDTGVHIEIPEGYAGILESKSGLNVKHNIVGTGTIDCGYTGSVVTKLYNHGKYDYTFKRGEKIIQLVLKRIATPRVKVVKSFSETERGDGGFGSTGE